MTYYYEGVDKVAAATAESLVAGDSLFVKAGVTIGSSDSHVGVSASGACSMTVYGTIMSVGNGAFFSSGGGNLVTIATGGGMSGGNGNGAAFSANDGNNFISNAGSMTGQTGIYVQATSAGQNQIVNTGTIAAVNTAIIVQLGGGNTIWNSGAISSGSHNAIILDSGSNSITNTGTIASTGDAAIAFLGTTGGVDLIDNSGTIAGAANLGPVITGGDNGLSVNNNGHINGSILFGAGSDFYNGEFGTLVNGSIIGQGGDDFITGGAGRTNINGGAGSDTLDGGAGRDIYRALAVSDSGGVAHDTILGFDAKKDKFDFNVAVTGIDATVASGQLRSDHFSSDVKGAVGPAQLAAHHAALFTATTGNLAGHTILVVDANGVAGFQTGDKDFVFDLTDADNLGSLDTGDFI